MRSVLSISKNIIQKIAIAILLVMIINVILPTNTVQADALDGTIGTMLAQILVWIGDSVMSLSQKIILGTEHSFIECDLSTSVWAWIAAIAAAIIVIAVAVIVSVCTCGAGAAAIAGAVIGAVASSAGTALTVGAVVFVAVSVSLPDDVNLPLFSLSPEAIFSNKIGLTDVNFFNPMNVKEYIDQDTGKLIAYYIDENDNGKLDETQTRVVNEATGEFEIEKEGETLTTKSTAYVLRETISNWYYALRNVAAIGLLSVLVYIGIRIIISSTASEKAKYKSMLGDWIVAIVLVFLLQYIMAFSITIVEKISKAIHQSSASIITEAIKNEDLIDKLSESDIQSDIAETYGIDISEYISGEYLIWPTNFLGQVRLKYQYLGETEQESVTNNIGYAIIYCVLVFFTLYYLIVYIKRAIYIAFLTIIAPLIALTYPIDKLNDGQAQGFNVWLKEYVYNLLIQPFHLILYTIFVSSAVTLATDYPLYTCVILGFLMPAEKLLRKIFNFNKAETTGQLSAAAGGALVGSAFSRLGNMAKGIGARTKQTAAKLGSGANNAGTSQYSGNTGTVDGFNGSDYGDNALDEQQNDNEEMEQMENDSAERRMLDADIENGDLSPEEREYYERNLAQPESPEMSRDEFREWAMNTGYSEEETEELLAEQYGNEEREEQLQPQEQNLARQDAQSRMRQERVNQIRDNVDNMRPKSIGKGRKFFSAVAAGGMRALPLLQRGSAKALGIMAGTVGTLGGAVIGLSSGEGVSGIVKNAGIGGAAGYNIGKGVPNAITRTTQGIGDKITAIPEGIENFRQDYQRLAYGQEAENRMAQERINRKEATEYVKAHHSELRGKEKKALIEQLTDTTVDAGIQDYELTDKALELQQQGVFQDEKQTKSLLKMASQIKGRDAYSDETKKSIQNMVNKKLIDSFIKEGIDEGTAKRRAKKATSDYMEKLYKLL